MTTNLVISTPEMPQKRRYSLDILILLFGISSWLLINSTYLQLPLLVEKAPEGWSLASYIVIVIQVGNVMPLLYNIIQSIHPFKDSIFITILLLIGITGSVLFGFYYDTTTHLLGEDRSVAMLIIVFTFALVGCTSSVLFMPYMGRFQEIYLITYLVGEGLSGLVPSLLALGQGVGGNTVCRVNNETESGFEYYTPPPRFSIQTFFAAIASIFIVCTIAFVLIDRLPTFKKQYSNVDIKSGNDYTYKKDETDSEISDDVRLSKWNYGYLMILMAIICFFTNGFFPSTQTYSVAPYGNLTYHWAIVMTSIANPAGCFVAFFLPHKGVRHISILTTITSVFAAYVIATSVMSPPPMHNILFGQIVIVISWTCLTALHSYVRLSINASFRNQGGRSLVWIGSCQQIGSLIGSIVAFLLIQYTTTFKQYDVCANFKS
ncbi:solute carrier family 52, riboflavin transporter, member 3-A [Culicoides brevitarsis]|uniref:solute carrier family 52, riboflavin transporter, member 3-A n=1 Tax=Culicoides brevitarsis TaxID=469753 RepID=UPI00307BF1C3